jgi:hypothetical protein
MFNLKQVGAWLIENELMDKPFNQFDESQIMGLCHVVVESITDPAVTAPVLMGDTLVLPATVPKKYKWWDGGQSIFETLTEMGAPAHVIEKHCPSKDRERVCKKRGVRYG